MTWYIAAILGLVEGLTEFLPVSSTGHLIIVGQWFHLGGESTKTFEIFIQLGAMLSVVWFYRARLLATARAATVPGDGQRLVVNLALGFLPAGVVGLLAHRWVKDHLFTLPVVGMAMLVGGVAILAIERWRPRSRTYEINEIRPATAFLIGCAQVLALVPGVSRSGATILGGYSLGLARYVATEFSFFLALPTLTAATLYDLYKSRGALALSDLPSFAIGFVVSFISALIVIKLFLRFVSRHSFVGFAWYRIAFGALLLLVYARHVG